MEHVCMCPHKSKTIEAELGLPGVQSSPLFFKVGWEAREGGSTCCVHLPLEGGGGTHLTGHFGASQHSRNTETQKLLILPWQIC